jgi:hypothetical protein
VHDVRLPYDVGSVTVFERSGIDGCQRHSIPAPGAIDLLSPRGAKEPRPQLTAVNAPDIQLGENDLFQRPTAGDPT